jgi:hypothetical protein
MVEDDRGGEPAAAARRLGRQLHHAHLAGWRVWLGWKQHGTRISRQGRESRQEEQRRGLFKKCSTQACSAQKGKGVGT